METQAAVSGRELPGGAVSLPDAISVKLKQKAEAAMRKIAVKKRKKRGPRKSRKITHDKTKASLELFGAGIDTPDWRQVKRFLKRNKKLKLSSLLAEASPVMRTIFGQPARLVLEVLKSPMKRSKKACLYLTIKSKLSEEEEGLAYDCFVERWWASRESRAKGRLTIGIASDDVDEVENIFDETEGFCLTAFCPCHVTWCRFHLNSDVHLSSIAFQKHGNETCILRLAQKTSHTLEEIGEMFGCTRERIRQIELVATHKTGHKLYRRGLISSADMTPEAWNRIRSMRKRKAFTIEDDRFRPRRPGRPCKSLDAGGDDRPDDESREA